MSIKDNAKQFWNLFVELEDEIVDGLTHSNYEILNKNVEKLDDMCYEMTGCDFFVENVFPEQTVAWIIAFICALGAVMSMVGDLAASAIKRNHNIKDYGKLIPGHGGIMDRFDSMTVTAPMIYFLTILMIRF